jgi:prepilin-type N-terminal cleavage/methylation domain-containing protein
MTTERAKKRKGYTLIEMLIVTSIMIIMSGVLLAYNHESERQLVLGVDGARVIGFLNRAKSFALGKYVGVKRGGGTADQSACAFGIHFDTTVTPNTMILFQDLPAPGAKCSDVDGFDKEFTPGVEAVDMLAIDARIRFVPTDDVVFEAPYLRTYVGGVLLGGEAGAESASLSIELPDGSASETIIVGAGGQIHLQ